MADSILKARITNKHDTAENWQKAGDNGFIPKPGEPIIYDTDSNHLSARAKYGDGKTNVNDIKFATPIESGAGKNSIVQTAEGDGINKADATNGNALGYGSIAGGKGFSLRGVAYKQDGIWQGSLPDFSLDEGIDEHRIIIEGSDGSIEVQTYHHPVTKKNGGAAAATGCEGYYITNIPTSEPCPAITLANGNNEFGIYFRSNRYGLAYADEWVVAKLALNWHEPATMYKEEYVWAFHTTNMFLPTNWNVNIDGKEGGTPLQKGYVYFPKALDQGDVALGTGSSAIGYNAKAILTASNASGYATIAEGKYANAEGAQTYASYAAHAGGKYCEARGFHSFAHGYDSDAVGNSSFASGYSSIAGCGWTKCISTGINTLTLQGAVSGLDAKDTFALYNPTDNTFYYDSTKTINKSSIQEDGNTLIVLASNLPEAYQNIGSSKFKVCFPKKAWIGDTGTEFNSSKSAFAHGTYSMALGIGSTALGDTNYAIDNYSAAIGYNNQAKGNQAEAFGLGLRATKEQAVYGRYNREDSDATVIIGAGTSTTRKNALYVKNDALHTDFISSDPNALTTNSYVDNKVDSTINSKIGGYAEIVIPSPGVDDQDIAASASPRTIQLNKGIKVLGFTGPITGIYKGGVHSADSYSVENVLAPTTTLADSSCTITANANSGVDCKLIKGKTGSGYKARFVPSGSLDKDQNQAVFLEFDLWVTDPLSGPYEMTFTDGTSLNTSPFVFGLTKTAAGSLDISLRTNSGLKSTSVPADTGNHYTMRLCVATPKDSSKLADSYTTLCINGVPSLKVTGVYNTASAKPISELKHINFGGNNDALGTLQLSAIKCWSAQADAAMYVADDLYNLEPVFAFTDKTINALNKIYPYSACEKITFADNMYDYGDSVYTDVLKDYEPFYLPAGVYTIGMYEASADCGLLNVSETVDEPDITTAASLAYVKSIVESLQNEINDLKAQLADISK